MAQRTHAIRVISRYGACFAIALLVIGLSPAIAKDKHPVIERFQATAMDLDTARATIVDIGIFAWSTEADRQALIQAFNEGGNDAVYKHMSKQDEMAFVKAPNTLGYQMRYAYQYESEGKRYVILGTDRPIAMGEVASGSRSQENNISFVTLDLDQETGKGTGMMVFGAEFKVNKKTGHLEIETLSMNPTKLTTVKTEKVKHKG